MCVKVKVMLFKIESINLWHNRGDASLISFSNNIVELLFSVIEHNKPFVSCPTLTALILKS